MNKMNITNAALQTITGPAKLAVLAAGMLFFSLAAQATTLTFNVTSGGTNSANNVLGNSRVFNRTDGSVQVTATAWSISNLTADFAASQLGLASGIGLWDCNPTEGVNCGSPQHQIDNSGGYDFLLFQFSKAVDPASVSIATYSNADLDVSYFLGNVGSNLSLTGVNLSELAGLGFGSRLDSDVNSYATSRAVSIVNNAGVNALLIGARISGDTRADAFKISVLKADSVSDVPEPGTFVLTGAALLGLGLYGRRRTKG